jgi:hypothetical protein
VEAICKRVEDLGLRVDVRRESEYLTEFTVYTTALSMNYLIRGKFIPEVSRQLPALRLEAT